MKGIKKLLLVLVMVVVAMLLLGWIKGPSKAERYESYIIQSGDTLWDIAVEFTPNNRDCRDTIDEIKEVNGIGNDIYTGQVICVPVYEED
jgi:nucleoid-associated protein YgaU